MDNLHTMPPVETGEETPEERNRRLIAKAGGLSTMPPVTPAQPRSDALSTPLTGRGRDLAVSATNQPTIPAPRTVATPEPEVGSSMPAVPLGPSPRPAPPYNPPAATPTGLPPVGRAEMAAPQPGAMPSVPVANQPLQKPPELHGWRKALDVIGSMFPIGRAIETAIPGTPQNFNAKQAMEATREATGQKLTEGRQRIEATEAQAQFNTPEKRRAYIAQHPDEFEGIDDFQKNDFVLSGKFPQREPTQPKEEGIDRQTYNALLKTTNPDTGKPYTEQEAYEQVKTAGQKQPPEKVDKKIDEFVDPKNNRVNVMQRPDGTTYNVVRGQSRSEAGVGSPTDVRDIAMGIMAGQDPPELTQYGYRDRTAIAAELKRQGFDLTRANQDWKATQRYLSSLNGPQQVRYRQAVDFATQSLDQAQRIFDWWQKSGATSGWKTFNKGSLAVAKQLPGEAGSAANNLEAAIADLTSELGTVYKGGNSSTDESLKLAAKNLSEDWNQQTFADAMKRIHESIGYRQNSMNHLPPAGVSPNSQYTSPAEKPPQDFGAAPAGKKEGDTGKLPDGTKIVVKGGRIVAQ